MPLPLQAGQVYRLRDLLEEWQVPPEFYERMSPCWHCELAAACDTQASQLDAVVNAVPLLAPSHLADSVFETTGPDALAFLTRPEWDAFPRPRLAMIGGWGAPGTALLGEDHLALVNSFSELLASEQRINLQMFHRDGCDMPRLPRLPDLLRWPLPVRAPLLRQAHRQRAGYLNTDAHSYPCYARPLQKAGYPNTDLATR